MAQNFYIFIATFKDGERVALTFDSRDAYNKYCEENEEDLTHIVIAYYERNKIKLIHDVQY